MDSPWNYFANAEADMPLIHYSGYIPGSEVNAGAGLYFNRWAIGSIKISPVVKIVGTHRWSDSGALALSEDTGFSRMVAGPGIEIGTSQIRVYGDVGFRIYQYTTGNQLDFISIIQAECELSLLARQRRRFVNLSVTIMRHTYSVMKSQTKTSALEIDQILSELSRLYLERFKTLRTGDHNDLQKITERIAALKAKLHRL